MSAFAFPLVVRPIPGETALSFMSRLADENGFLLISVLRDIAKLRRPDKWEQEDWERLAARAYLPVEALEPFRRRSAEIPEAPFAIKFMGRPVHPHSLVTDKLRICPTCIGERRMLKEVWRLDHCIACVEHETLLVDTCECGRVINTMTRGLDPFSCFCGTAFAEIQTRKASTNALQAAQWLLQAFGASMTALAPERWLVRQEHIGMPFYAMEAYDVMSVIELIGDAATTPAHEDEYVTPQKRWAKGNTTARRDLTTTIAQVEAAMDVLHNWPDSYQALLEDVAGRNEKAGTERPRDLFATRIGQTMLTPFKGLDGQPIQVLQHEVDSFLVRKGYKLRQKVPTRSSATARDIHSLLPCSKAAMLLGFQKNNTSLKRVYRETVEAFDAKRDEEMTPELLAREVLAEVKRRMACADDYMSPSAASEHLNHENIATYSNMWIHPELLQPVEPDRAVTPHMKGHAFLRADVIRMRQRIEDAAGLVDKNEIPDGFEPYGIASKAGVDAAYTGTDLLLDMLSGTVPIVRTGPMPRLTDLYVHTLSARTRALERRVSKIIERDQFAGTSWVEYVLATLWPNRPEKLTINLNRQLRADDAVRFQTKINSTEGRERPLYFYSIVDHMLRARKMFGSSVSPNVDDQIKTVAHGHRQACTRVA